MDRFTALGIARCYGLFDDADASSLWRDPPVRDDEEDTARASGEGAEA